LSAVRACACEARCLLQLWSYDHSFLTSTRVRARAKVNDFAILKFEETFYIDERDRKQFKYSHNTNGYLEMMKLENGVLYFNKAKAQNLNTERLQLPWDFTSDNGLFAHNIKTEADLGQYQSQQNNTKSKADKMAQSVTFRYYRIV